MSITISFTDNSAPGPSGPITDWSWDFGDGGSSTDQNPTHIYAAADSYDVTLTVTGTGADGTATVTQSVGVVDPATNVLTSVFSFSPSGLTVDFTDASLPGPSGPITGWSWDFGDGGTSTSRNPTHPYASSGTRTVTLTVTGTSPDGTDSSNTSVTVAANTGTVLFDGRAVLMSALFSHETTPGDLSTLVHGQTPTIWDGLTFENDDISLSTDARYGKAYKCEVAIGDRNPWNTGAPLTNGAAEISKKRPNDLGKWDYFAIGLKVPSWSNVSGISFATVLSVGYETLKGDQVGLGLINQNGTLAFQVHQNSGHIDTTTGLDQPTVSYRSALMPVVYGQWREFVLAVKWATDNTGAVQVHSRLPGSAWSKVFERLNTPTSLWGTNGNYGTRNADGSNWTGVLDKIGLYYSLGGAQGTETVYISGLSRCSDLATAKAQFPA